MSKKYLPLRKHQGYKEVRCPDGVYPCDTKCALMTETGCKSGTLVPSGCSSFNRNTYWVVDEDLMLTVQEQRMKDAQRELFAAREAHKAWADIQLCKINKLRNKIAILRKDGV